jgi:hypothetical protein
MMGKRKGSSKATPITKPRRTIKRINPKIKKKDLLLFESI